MGQRKPFCWQRIPYSSGVRKETVDIDILITSTNEDRKSIQPATITSGPPDIARKWNEFTLFRLTFTKVIPIKKRFRCLREVASVGPTVLHIYAAYPTYSSSN